MSCLYNSGYSLANNCFDAVGGVSAFFIGNFSAGTSYSYDATGTITGITSAPTFYKIEQRREQGIWNDPHTQSEDGTNVWKPSATMTFLKVQASNRDLVKTMSQTTSSIIVLTNSGEYIILGEENGMTTPSIEGAGGQKFEDFQGYKINFEGKERNPARIISATAFGTLTVV